jgi:aldose 1-epimerase
MNAAAIALLAVLMAPATQAAGYSAEIVTVDGIEVVRLANAARRVQVSVIPSIGNLAYEMRVGESNILWFPHAGLQAFRSKPALCGIPFLAPWANRLDRDGFRANGKRYRLNGEIGNLTRDANGKPLHGLLAFSPHWKVAAVEANAGQAWVTSRLEFWRHPELMAQFPFAHSIQMTYRLSRGALEVETVLENHAEEPMPVAIGFHPYVRLPGAPRAAWQADLPVREQLVLSDEFIPTGERQAVSPAGMQPFLGLARGQLYSKLARGEDGRAEFRLESGRARVSVVFGPRYKVGLVYGPPGAEFVCFEPMTAPTDGFNLASDGKYPELETVPPGGRWKESFWVVATGIR